jgi:hypothetical protein
MRCGHDVSTIILHLARCAVCIGAVLLVGAGVSSAYPPGATVFYLHSTTSANDPSSPTFVLDNTPPTATTASSQASAILTVEGGNPWQEIGVWEANAAGSTQVLTALGDLQLWFGPRLAWIWGWIWKDIQAPRLDLRAEIYHNDTLVAAGNARCIEGVTSSSGGTRQVAIPFAPFLPMSFEATDVLSLRILTRMGTNEDDSFCGGHSRALGLRLYFDAISQPAGFAATFEPLLTGPDTDGDGIPDEVDCNPELLDHHVVDPLGVVPIGFVGGRHDTLQAAVSAALDNQVISMYADTAENVIIGSSTGSEGVDLRIVGCGHKVTAADPSLAALHVEPTAGANDGDHGAGERDIHVEDLNIRGAHHAVGILVETSSAVSGTATLLKVMRSEDNQVGLRVGGDGNEVRGSNGVKLNASDGIQVLGHNNLIIENDIEDNDGDGIGVVGSHNLIKKNRVGDGNKGNAGNGLRVAGAGNIIEENDVFANGGNGIVVSGGTATSPNVLKKNDVGDVNKGNAGHGIFIHDDIGGGASDAAELEENRVKSNLRSGIQVAGSGHVLKNNRSGGSSSEDNAGCEFDVEAGNFSATGNTTNDETVLPDAHGAPFPTGCLGTP